MLIDATVDAKLKEFSLLLTPESFAVSPQQPITHSGHRTHRHPCSSVLTDAAAS